MNATPGAPQWRNRLLQTDLWAVWLTLAFTGFSFFFAVPSFNFLRNAATDPGWQVVMQQKESGWFIQPDVPPALQAAKKTFRITVPLVIKALHLNVHGTYAVQVLLGILFLFLVLQFINGLTESRWLAAAFTLGFTALFVGRACFTDVYSRFEGWCFLLMFLSIYFGRPGLIFLCAFLACWTDERAVLGLANAMLWWYCRDNGFSRPDWSHIRRLFSSRAAMVGYAVLSYLLIRFFVQWQFGFYTPSRGVAEITYIPRAFALLPLGIWTFFEGFWILVLLAAYALYRSRYFFFFALALLINVVMLLSSFLVFDVTRSGAFMFLLLFVALVAIQRRAPGRLVPAVRYGALVCVLFPPYFIILDTLPYVLLHKSVPMHVIDALFRGII